MVLAQTSRGQASIALCGFDSSFSGVYLVRLGRKRWAIEGLFKTIKHRFGLHRFGQSTQISIYRWLILSFVAYLYSPLD
ncbi:hypothetical protein C7B82_06070 [Stenomitos frigidus ULC18]|uniref:Transposase IS4-like domain-containing protein n=1 Tax=Stenomitos frigidus ULC18 TaxID=2107698 RepID=A0A2T1EHM1_9CYAN|nr:hypothetical protein C7B82_06070 [Stenomitos frigidus ULC18]